MLRLPLFQEAELQRVQKVRELELAYARSQLELEVSKAQQLAEVEVNKFKQMTEALGPSTIRDLAVAGPEMQVRLGREQERVCVTRDHTWNPEGHAVGLGEAEMGQAYTPCPVSSVGHCTSSVRDGQEAAEPPVCGQCFEGSQVGGCCWMA